MGKIKKLTKAIIKWLENYKEETGCKGVVLGLSGGKDSTTVAMLAKKVWGDNVVALLMPNGEQKDLSDAISIANTLKIDYHIINIGKVYKALIDSIETLTLLDSDGLPIPISSDIKVTDKAKSNIPPRIRMMTLYAVAQSLGYRVIGTGNKSEAYIGWCTKWGDTAYDLNPIGNLTCSEVIEIGKKLAKKFGLDEKYIVKTPADGLTGKSDEENFGFSYEDLDWYISDSDVLGIIAPWFMLPPKPIEGIHCVPIDVTDKIDKMHEASEHKRSMPPCFEP